MDHNKTSAKVCIYALTLPGNVIKGSLGPPGSETKDMVNKKTDLRFDMGTESPQKANAVV